MNRAKTGEEKKPRDLVGSIAHGLKVIKSFDEEHPQMTLSQVAERTGMNRAGARRYLLTFLHLGYVAQDGRLFRLTPKILELGYAYFSTTPLSAIAQPYLEHVRDVTGEAVALAILDGDSIVHIARASTQKLLAPTLTIGKRFQAIYTSTGRSILATKDKKEIKRILSESALPRITRWTITSKDKLRKELNTIRQQGYAVVDQEMEEGVRSLAVPILDNEAVAVAAMNIVTNVAAISKEQLISEFLPILKEAAEDLQIVMIAK